MHFGNQHIFVVRTVENADSSSFRERAIDTPEIIMVQFFSRRLFERIHLASLWVNAGHHMLDSPVFSCSIHRLKDNQD